METEPGRVADAYWRFHRLSAGNREERLSAEASSEVLDAFWNTVDDAPTPAVLRVVDELLAHPSADAGLVGAGPVEDLLHRDDVEDWDEELARRCRTSAAWRDAVYSAAEPNGLDLPALRPYLRPAPHAGSRAAKTDTPKRRANRDLRQRRRDRR